MMHEEAVAAVRSFNRFYTRVLGLLDQHFLDSPYSLTEVRVLFEIFHQRGSTARQIKDFLQIDEGYCSRLLERLVALGLIRRTRTTGDGRRYALSLTASGRKAFLELNQRSERAIGTLIGGLSSKDATRLVSSVRTIQTLLEGRIEQ